LSSTVLCLAGGNASATCLNLQVMRLADVPLPLSFLLHFAAQYKCLVIIIIIIIIIIIVIREHLRTRKLFYGQE